MHQERESHLKEISNLKSDINFISNQLEEKLNQLRTLTERTNCLEKLLKEKNDEMVKTNQELIVIERKKMSKLNNICLKLFIFPHR